MRVNKPGQSLGPTIFFFLNRLDSNSFIENFENFG
jgi:hypothetical protein